MRCGVRRRGSRATLLLPAASRRSRETRAWENRADEGRTHRRRTVKNPDGTATRKTTTTTIGRRVCNVFQWDIIRARLQ